MWHLIDEYCQVCSKGDIGLTLKYGIVKYGTVLKHKNSLKVLKIYIKEGSNDDLGLKMGISMAMSNLLLCFYMGIVHRICRKFWCTSFIGEHEHILLH